MQVSGEAAKGYKAVRLDSFAEFDDLVAADEMTGEIEYRDTPDSTKKLTIAGGVRLLPKQPRRSW